MNIWNVAFVILLLLENVFYNISLHNTIAVGSAKKLLNLKENKYNMLSKRTLYSFISFRFVKLALPRGHKSKKENVFQKTGEHKFGLWVISFLFLGLTRWLTGDLYFQGQIVILETIGPTPVWTLWRLYILATLWIKLEF